MRTIVEVDHPAGLLHVELDGGQLHVTYARDGRP